MFNVHACGSTNMSHVLRVSFSKAIHFVQLNCCCHRQDEVKDGTCIPPFGMETLCHAPLSGIFYWPTTPECAQALANMHGVNASYTLSIQKVLEEANSQCSTRTTKVRLM